MGEVQSTFNYFKQEAEEPKEAFNWSSYNASQMREKVFFVRLLRELCDLITEPKHQRGRKPRSMGDTIYALGLKTYLLLSSRRSCGDVKLSQKAGYVKKEYHFNTLLKYLNNPDIINVLKELIEISAMPLKQVESDFAIDATGFCVSRFVRYFDVRYGMNTKIRIFRKCHAVCGTKTNIITSADVTPGPTHDSKKFEGLVIATSRNFSVKEISADKGYLSKKNYNIVKDLGGTAFIPFKESSTGKAKVGGNSYVWRQMFKFFKENKEEFYKHYNKRQNIESCWSMIKARFGMNLRCKKDIAQDNEILLKILCHNICILIQEIFLNNIEVDFKQCEKDHVAHK